MAHDDKTKAAAISLMLLGTGVRETARVLNLPVSTVSRWHPEATAYMRQAMKANPELARVAAMFRTKRNTLSHSKRNPKPDQT